MLALSLTQVAKLVAFITLLSAGQTMFKFVAVRQKESILSLDGIVALCTDMWFLISLCLYGLATLLWIHILQNVPLYIAYPFVALGFVIVPLCAWVFFKEPVNVQYFLGVLLIIIGLIVTQVKI